MKKQELVDLVVNARYSDALGVCVCAGATIAVDEFLADKPEKLSKYRTQYYFEKM